jgi:hypothetical protein
MTSLMRIILVTSALILPLGGCASIGDAIDPTEWFSGDMFSGKKKLPGDRKPVFPQGVPGVSQGIPSDLVKGNQQPPLESGYAVTDTQSVNSTPRPATARTAARTDATRTDATNTDTAKTDEYQPAPREKAKPKPKPKPATAERQPATQERQQPSSGSARRAPEPQQVEQPQRSQQAGSGSGGVQWPDPPAQQRSGGQAGGVQWPDPPPLR